MPRFRPAICTTALLAFAGAVPARCQAPSRPAKYLFVWTGDGDQKLSDFLAVLDADPSSPGYGHVVSSLPVMMVGTGPHHTEQDFPADGMLLAQGWPGSRTFLFDLRQPTSPKVVTSFTSVGPYSFAHSFARLTNGHILTTFQGRGHAYAPPGGLVEMDEHGTLIRSASAAGAGLADTMAWPYSIAVDVNHDRIVTTNHVMPIPGSLKTPAGSWTKARADKVITKQVQIWSLSGLKLLSTVVLPAPAFTPKDGLPANVFPAEPRLLPDGSVYVNTFSCGLYRIADVAAPQPHAKLVYTFLATPFMVGMACAVPAIVGHYWIQTVTALPGLVALDISDPARPRKVSQLVLGDAVPMPHWMASDPGGSRVVITGLASGRVIVVNVDPRTGALALDTRFQDERSGGPGVDLSGRTWPHGTIANAYAHGTLFGPR